MKCFTFFLYKSQVISRSARVRIRSLRHTQTQTLTEQSTSWHYSYYITGLDRNCPTSLMRECFTVGNAGRRGQQRGGHRYVAVTSFPPLHLKTYSRYLPSIWRHTASYSLCSSFNYIHCSFKMLCVRIFTPKTGDWYRNVFQRFKNWVISLLLCKWIVYKYSDTSCCVEICIVPQPWRIDHFRTHCLGKEFGSFCYIFKICSFMTTATCVALA
jgi:hypothetical protein